MNAETIHKANVAVEKFLMLDKAIDAHRGDIYRGLEASNQHAQDTINDNDVVFFADCIPWIASIIQVHVSQENFLGAVEWAKSAFATNRPISILTALTTIYLINKGYEEHSAGASAEKRSAWEQIFRRMNHLLEQSL